MAMLTARRAVPLSLALTALSATGCTSLDYEVIPALRSAEIHIDSQAPDDVAEIEFEIELQSGRLADRCIDTQLALRPPSFVGEEVILELEADADFDPCFDGEQTRTLTLTNVEMTNAALSELCVPGTSWAPTFYTEVEDNEKTGWGLTNNEPLSISCT
ncbi:hypothetical protein PPSIR1_33079 [Plesiocystis pacifica SIR-1]|uniref:Lipoprotein n=2 Tax=Plesiocystis pacifica TaxID=191768 RepID=A6GJ47_9BACT|nr:hypothetical protein PPSIR1_33079 [Plesiocystis pacifica SIR-1]